MNQSQVDVPVQDRMAALNKHVAHWLGHERWRLSPASSDASFRRYFRVAVDDGNSYIVMDAPPPREDCRPFVRIARQFRQLGLNVPEIIAQDLPQGFLLLSDLGDRIYLPELSDSSVDQLYAEAVSSIALLQAAQGDGGLPPYDRQRLHFEVSLFHEWFLGRYLNIPENRQPRDAIEAVYSAVIDSALEQPQVWVHRDFHSRNLMLTNDGHNPGVLDFQDAVVGPITYDLVSLFRDCYIGWPAEKVYHWLAQYRLRYLLGGGIADVNDQREFERWFDLMGMQRHLKCVGIFARLNIRDGKQAYLQHIPRTFQYIVDVLQRYRMFPAFNRFIQDSVLPALNKAKH